MSSDNSFDIRFGIPSDVDLIMSLERSSLDLPWSRDAVMRLLTSSDNVLLISFAAVCPSVGYVGVTGVMDEAEIGNLVVVPDQRGKGAGTALMEFVIEELRRRSVSVVFLEVESSNVPAIALYEKLGFERYGMRDGYYGPGKDALLMRLEL